MNNYNDIEKSYRRTSFFLKDLKLDQLINLEYSESDDKSWQKIIFGLEEVLEKTPKEMFRYSPQLERSIKCDALCSDGGTYLFPEKPKIGYTDFIEIKNKSFKGFDVNFIEAQNDDIFFEDRKRNGILKYEATGLFGERDSVHLDVLLSKKVFQALSKAVEDKDKEIEMTIIWNPWSSDTSEEPAFGKTCIYIEYGSPIWVTIDSFAFRAKSQEYEKQDLPGKSFFRKLFGCC